MATWSEIANFIATLDPQFLDQQATIDLEGYERILPVEVKTTQIGMYWANEDPDTLIDAKQYAALPIEEQEEHEVHTPEGTPYFYA